MIIPLIFCQEIVTPLYSLGLSKTRTKRGGFIEKKIHVDVLHIKWYIFKSNNYIEFAEKQLMIEVVCTVVYRCGR